MRWKMKKIKKIMQFFECFLLNWMKNEENKGNNAIVWMVLVKCDEKWRICKEIMQFFNVSCWIGWKMKKIKEIMMRCDSVETFFFIDALAHSPISVHSFISLMTEKWWEKTFQEVKGKSSKNPFLVKCDEKWRKCKEIMQFFNVSCWMR